MDRLLDVQLDRNEFENNFGGIPRDVPVPDPAVFRRSRPCSNKSSCRAFLSARPGLRQRAFITFGSRHFGFARHACVGTLRLEFPSSGNPELDQVFRLLIDSDELAYETEDLKIQ